MSEIIPEPAIVDAQAAPTLAQHSNGLAALLARVEKADGPSPLLDCDIGIALGEWSPPRGFQRERDDYPWRWSKKQHNAYQPHNPLSSSLDAALALVERVLPGWLPRVAKLSGGLWFADLVPIAADAECRSEAKTPALALLAALLKALIAGDRAASRDEGKLRDEQ